MNHTGLFITFEGIDGSGKSTHIERTVAELHTQGHRVTSTREPGGTALGESLRHIVLAQDVDPLTEALLMFAARRHHLRHVIEPALARGEVVLCDRFTDSSFAYQGYGHGLDLPILGQLEAWVQARDGGSGSHALRQPDITFWFDIDPHLAAQRRSGRAGDRFEAQPVSFFERVAAGYAARAEQDPQRFVRIAAHAPMQDVWLALRQGLERAGCLGPQTTP